MEKMKKYSGQAIAIIMVVLVVATVVGASLYSRVLTNRQTSFETSESVRALGEADSILEVFITSDLLQVQKAFRECIEGNDPIPCEFTDMNELITYFETYIDVSTLETTANWCADAADDENNMRVTISFADGTDPVEYEPGKLKAINFEGATIPESCRVDFFFNPLSTENPLFTVKKVYMDGSGNVKPYELDDMLLYCVDSSIPCDTVPIDSIKYPTFVNAQLGWKLSYTPFFEISGGYPIYELRILPLKHLVNIALETADCGNLFDDYKIVADVTCSGLNGAKQVIVPSERSLGYPALFDYTLFNAEGVLRPN